MRQEWLFALTIWLIGGPVAQAGSVPAAQSFIWVNCAASGDSLVGTDPARLSCERTFDTPYGTTVAVASASTLGESLPGVSIFHRVESDDELLDPAFKIASTNVSLRYFFAVRPIADAPFAIDTVPVIFQASGEIDLQGTTSIYGHIAVTDDQLVFRAHRLDNTSPSADVERRFSYSIDATRGVDLYVLCASTLATTGMSSCLASVSVMLTLDQEMFDSIYGPDSFELSDFFEIEMSPGLTAVPLPGALGLLLLALAGFLPFRRKMSPAITA